VTKLTMKDLDLLVSFSKDKMFYLNPPLFIGGKEVERGYLASIANFEALLMFLNSKGLLKEEVGFDFTHNYEDNDSTELEER
jgi:hypothetical protein